MFRAVFLILAIIFLALFQNCSKASFSQGTGGSGAGGVGAGLNYGGEELGLAHSGDSADGTVFQPAGGGGATGAIVSPPQPFSSTNCNIAYPFASSTPATNVVFNESDVLIGYSPSGSAVATPGMTLSVWYSDEHAMTLGVRQIVVKSATGSVATNYDVSALNAVPGMILNPRVGALNLTGDQAGTDVSTCPGVPYVCARPMFPALFITDVTGNPSNVSGDWQYGGKPTLPHAVFGTWKSAVRVVDQTMSPPTVIVKPDADPAPNNTDLGGIPYPAGMASGNEGFSSVVSWEIDRLGLVHGHTYRLQFMVHDGDETRAGGDTGQNCMNITF